MDADRHIVSPLASLVGTEQVRMGDVLSIDWEASEGHLVFQKEGENVVVSLWCRWQMRQLRAAA